MISHENKRWVILNNLYKILPDLPNVLLDTAKYPNEILDLTYQDIMMVGVIDPNMMFSENTRQCLQDLLREIVEYKESEERKRQVQKKQTRSTYSPYEQQQTPQANAYEAYERDIQNYCALNGITVQQYAYMQQQQFYMMQAQAQLAVSQQMNGYPQQQYGAQGYSTHHQGQYSGHHHRHDGGYRKNHRYSDHRYQPRDYNQQQQAYDSNQQRQQVEETETKVAEIQGNAPSADASRPAYKQKEQVQHEPEQIPVAKSPETKPVNKVEEPVKAPEPEPPKVIEKPTLEAIKAFMSSFKDYSNIRSDLKARVEELQTRKVVTEEVKFSSQPSKSQYDNKHKKGPKNPQPAPVTTTTQISLGRRDPATEVKAAPTEQEKKKAYPTASSTVLIVRKEENEEVMKTKKALVEGAKMKLDEKANTGSMSDLQKAEREIKFNLNLITLDNFQKIKAILLPYVTNDMTTCEKLICFMIEKAWIEPKFASIYAKLSKDFAKLKEGFQYNSGAEGKGESKNNPFKMILIKRVQKVFEENEEEKNSPAKADKEKASAEIKNRKKKIIGNVRFIGELIIEKVMARRVSSICVGTLLEHFFFENYSEPNFMNNELAEIFMEAVIELIEKIGERFEGGEEKPSTSYPELHKAVMHAIKNKTSLDPNASEHWNFITTNEFFDLFSVIDVEILKNKFHRVSALLKNLVERRGNNWKAHLGTETGPKLLEEVRKEVHEGIVEEEVQTTKPKKGQASVEDLEKMLNDIFSKLEKGSYIKEEMEAPIPYGLEQAVNDFKKIIKTSKDHTEAYAAFLRVFAEGKKDDIVKRVDMFREYVQNTNMFVYEDFVSAWKKSGNKLTYSDFPYSASGMGKLLADLYKIRAFKVGDFHYEAEDEEEIDYIKEVYLKFNYYAGGVAGVEAYTDLKAKARMLL